MAVPRKRWVVYARFFTLLIGSLCIEAASFIKVVFSWNVNLIDFLVNALN